MNSKYDTPQEKGAARAAIEGRRRRQRFVDRVELKAYRRVFKEKGILMTTVIEEIAAERQRQRDEEGWTDEHDDKHDDGSMALAAACYSVHAVYGANSAMSQTIFTRLWRWSTLWWKPKSRRRDLVRAAALIVAEIERLDRAEARAKA
jgi:hypothetical protein